MTYSFHDSGKNATIAGILQVTKTEGVEDSNGTGPHGKNIPQDASDSGSGTLEGFHRRRMIMGLDFEG